MIRPLILSLIATLASAEAPAAAPGPTSISIKLDELKAAPARPIAKSFAGFSREWRRFPFPASGKLDEVHPKYLQLLRNLAAFNDEGFNIRIGGASADGIKEVPDSNRWKQIAQAYEATRTPLIITLNLARGDVQLCKDFIHAAKTHLPAQAIRGFELGNEPDGWNGKHRPKDYKWETYFEEFTAMTQALTPSELPSIIGPAWAHGLPPDIAGTLLKMNPGRIAMFTGHAYSFAPATGPHPEKLLKEESLQKTLTFLSPGIEFAHSKGLPFRLGETGSAWGSGIPGFSDTFASTLWILDFCCSLAHAGLDGVNFHGGGKGHYSPIQDDSDDKKGITRSITVKPSYYGLLMFCEAAANHASIAPLPSAGSVKLWSLTDTTGQRRVIAINKDLQAPVTLTFHGKSLALQVKRLEAPNIAAVDGVRYAGQTFDDSADGKLVGQPDNETIQGSEALAVTLKPASAALLTITSD